MATADNLLREIKSKIKEITVTDARERFEHGGANFLDVREPDEYKQGFIPGTAYIPRGFLESRIERAFPDKSAPITIYCAGGNRSAYAARSLEELGYTDVVSVIGGFNSWKNGGHPWTTDLVADMAGANRYSRHISVPEVGLEGQKKLLNSRVLLVGAGGLGSPAALYLAAAGIGTIGIIDADIVDESNLQRQVIHSTLDIGRKKIDSARESIRKLNPDVKVVSYDTRIDSSNVFTILDEGWDAVLNGCDNFPTRYLLNDACYWKKIPLVDGSIFRFEGQVTIYKPDEGPCYRCLYPEPPPPELAPSCAEAGVLGVLPGLIGVMQALETIKLILNIGTPLVGKLALFDALDNKWRNVKLRKDPHCVLCSDHPKITELIDYDFFCSTVNHDIVPLSQQHGSPQTV